MHKLLRLRELTLTEWTDLGCAVMLLPAAELGLRLLGFKRTSTLMAPRGTEAAVGVDGPRARAMARMVSIAATYGPYRTTCLRRALVLRWMLARIGIAGELRIGVRKGAPEGIEAHAWVEVEGEILGESPKVAQRFAAFEDGSAQT